MTDFLNSVKADLLDRRLLPIVALVFVGLAAAIAYVVIGGGASSGSTPAPSASVVAPAPAGLTTSQSSSTTSQAVAETTNGTPAEQHQGKARDPFTALPGVKAASSAGASASGASATPTAGSGAASKSSSPSSGTPSAPSTTPAAKTPSKPLSKPKPHAVYDVSVLFGLLPAGETAATVQLYPYTNLKLQTPLPEKPVLLIYRGVPAGGKSATFTVYGEVILHGAGSCLPSTSQCEAIDLKPGQTEQVEYLSETGEPQIYELRVVSITPASASAAGVRNALQGEDKAGRKLLREAGLTALPYLRYSTKMGVLVFEGHRGLSPVQYRAHIALQHSRRGR
jgi:hypothetical protein